MFIYVLAFFIVSGSDPRNRQQALTDSLGRLCVETVMPALQCWIRRQLEELEQGSSPREEITTTITPTTTWSDRVAAIPLNEFHAISRRATEWMKLATEGANQGIRDPLMFKVSMKRLCGLIHRLFNDIYIAAIRASVPDPNTLFKRGITLLLPFAKTLPEIGLSDWGDKRKTLLYRITLFRLDLIGEE